MSTISYILAAGGVWTSILVTLAAPKGFFKSQLDKVVKGRLNKDRLPLQIIMDNLFTNPENWSISRDSAHFPKEGAKQVSFMKDKNGWEYSLSNGNFRSLDGYYSSEIGKFIERENSLRESRALLRNFYPELEGTLLLR